MLTFRTRFSECNGPKLNAIRHTRPKKVKMHKNNMKINAAKHQNRIKLDLSGIFVIWLQIVCCLLLKFFIWFHQVNRMMIRCRHCDGFHHFSGKRNVRAYSQDKGRCLFFARSLSLSVRINHLMVGDMKLALVQMNRLNEWFWPLLLFCVHFSLWFIYFDG